MVIVQVTKGGVDKNDHFNSTSNVQYIDDLRPFDTSDLKPLNTRKWVTEG